MRELIFAGFDDQKRALEVRNKLLAMEKEHLLDLEDAVVAERREDGKVKLHQVHHLTAAGAVTGGFWGALIGLLFLNPAFGLVIGAGIGAVTGALTDVGIDDDYMKRVSNVLRPGTSGLFILVRRATPDKVIEELRPFDGTILSTSLSHEDEQKLRAALHEGVMEAAPA